MSSSLRRPTLTERKPPPTGVVIGPLSAVPASRIASSVSGGSGFPPCSAMTSSPAPRTSHSKSTPVASSTRRVASVSSGPVPPAGMRTTRWAIPAHDSTGASESGRRVDCRAMNDFKPGLEGIVAVETEIAEPDREGGVLRYRGIDITELVGQYPYENVWGLLVDNDLHVTMPEPEPYEPVGLTGNAPADLQAETARLAGKWKLGKTNEISDEQAREDLGRLSAQMMGIVARSARIADGKTDQVPADVVARGKTAAEKFLLQWRGEADPKAVRAIDTYWICTAEHGLNASTFTARVVASTGADCGAALSSAVG